MLLSVVMLAWVRSRLERRQDDRVAREALQLAAEEIKQQEARGKTDLKEVRLELVASSEAFAEQEKLVEYQVRRHLTEKSALFTEAESEVLRYLPPLPRNAKRMLNRLRVLLVIAHEREMFDDSSQLTARHIGKWAVLRERWPELAQALAVRPEEMAELEGQEVDWTFANT